MLSKPVLTVAETTRILEAARAEAKQIAGPRRDVAGDEQEQAQHDQRRRHGRQVLQHVLRHDSLLRDDEFGRAVAHRRLQRGKRFVFE